MLTLEPLSQGEGRKRGVVLLQCWGRGEGGRTSELTWGREHYLGTLQGLSSALKLLIFSESNLSLL